MKDGFPPVIPAEAGIRAFRNKRMGARVPASAGMTEGESARYLFH